MKRTYMFALFASVLVIIASIAIAGEMRGEISELNIKTGEFTVISEKNGVDFESKAGVLPKYLEVDDAVIIKFDEENGKKRATKIRKVPTAC